MHMTSIEERSNEVSNYVTKLEGLKQMVQAKTTDKKSHNVGNFSRSYSKGLSHHIYLAHPI